MCVPRKGGREGGGCPGDLLEYSCLLQAVGFLEESVYTVVTIFPDR